MFHNLGRVEPRAVSGDGSVVVGGYALPNPIDEEFEAFRWTSSEGVVGLGDFPGRNFESFATGVSADGSVIVGYGTIDAGFMGFRWTAATGLVPLGSAPAENGYSAAWDVSADGQTVVGTTGPSESGSQGDDRGFRWTASGGMTALDRRTGIFPSYARGVSATGSVVVGADNNEAAILYPSLDVVGGLPRASQSLALDVSYDGSVAVGLSLIGGESLEAVRWVNGGPADGLGFIPGGLSSQAHAISADGTIIVGNSGILDPQLGVLEYAAIWDAEHGMRDLKSVLEAEHGLSLPGWRLKQATDISADGRTIVGQGIDPFGADVGWVVTVPEPNGLWALAAVMFAVGRRLACARCVCRA
jgi:uncharacterized membrane protein